MATIDLGDWIFEENIRAWLEIISTIVGYEFDDLDWDAVAHGIADSDAERSRWYEQPLADGDSRVSLAKDRGTAVVRVRAVVPLEAFERAKLATTIAQTYRLVSRH